MAAKSGSLTGGSGDVNPQFLNASFTQSAANSTDTFTLGTPIVRVGADSRGNATIMEILKIFWELPNINAAGAAQTFRGVDIVMMTSAPAATGTFTPFSNGKVIMNCRHSTANCFTAGGTGMTIWDQNPRVVDLTDGAGHGVLVAVDNLYFQISTVGMPGQAETFQCKILYRFKTVKLVEYIGIVQSQQ